QAAEGQTDDGDRRDQRVPQPVPKDDRRLAQSLGPRRSHVVLAEDLEHARSRHSCDDRRREIAERQRGKDEMVEAAAERLEIACENAVDDVEARAWWRWLHECVEAPTAGKPSQLVIEEPDYDETEPEHRHRSAREREEANDEVGQAAPRDR